MSEKEWAMQFEMAEKTVDTFLLAWEQKRFTRQDMVLALNNAMRSQRHGETMLLFCFAIVGERLLELRRKRRDDAHA